VAHAVIVALGCSPGLGFIHTGHYRAFVYDIADLFKADIAIPAAFEAAMDGPQEIGARTRRLVRDRAHREKLLDRMTESIKVLLADESAGITLEEVLGALDDDIVGLWDEGDSVLPGGTNYWQDE
jgi:CRISPR-associated protein Cas1